jgi:hypothetical protein
MQKLKNELLVVSQGAPDIAIISSVNVGILVLVRDAPSIAVFR